MLHFKYKLLDIYKFCIKVVCYGKVIIIIAEKIDAHNISQITNILSNNTKLTTYQLDIPECISFNGLQIDYNKRLVILQNNQISLNHLEFEVLYFLASYPEHIFSREQIFDRIWKDKNTVNESHAVSCVISSIRKKIGKHYIKTVPNMGYKFTIEK